MESEIKYYTSVFLDVTGSRTLLRYGINKILGKFDLYCIWICYTVTFGNNAIIFHSLVTIVTLM